MSAAAAIASTAKPTAGFGSVVVEYRYSHTPHRFEPKPTPAILRRMKVEEIAEAVAKLPPDQLSRFRRWFTAFEAGRTDHVEELDSAAAKFGRLAGRAFADLKRRAKEP